MTKQPPIIPSETQAREDFADTIGRLIIAFSAATTEARDYVRLKGEDDQSFYSHQVRYVAKVILKHDGIETEDCELEDTANSGLCFVTPKYRVRVVKSASGQIPDPGTSDRRKRFLNQQPEQQMDFDFAKPPSDDESTKEAPKEVPREPAHIVFLWETDPRNTFTGIWFICPNGTSKPHFKVWIEAPEVAGAGLERGTPPPVPPPADLGFTTKEDNPNTPKKTGTEE